jgi:hypothetical protein
MGEAISWIILWVIVVVVLWLLLRELVCWYYKINERITLQKETNELLKKLLQKMSEKEAS